MIEQSTRDYPLITCPYCFKKFGHQYVHFKAMTVFTKQDIEQEQKINDVGSNEDDIFGSVAEESDDNKEIDEKKAFFIEVDDTQYENFWNQYPGSGHAWKYRRHPVITTSDGKFMSGGYRKDADGFVYAVVDCYGAESSIRLCPLCHNQLPANYGKYPVKFISTVGITASGKTVYISQLIKNFGTYMTRVGMGTFKLAESVDVFLKNNPVKQGTSLPMGTTIASLSVPLFYNIKNKDTYTLVFYDIAGENCISADGLNKFGVFIKNADGIIMILDPKQFQRIDYTFTDEIASPESVVNAMYSAFLDSVNVDGKTDVPLAICFSKSDTLKDNPHINENSNIFRDVAYEKIGFNMKDQKNISGEVSKVLKSDEQGQQLLTTINTCFSKIGFFAFSALNCDVKKVEKEQENGKTENAYEPLEVPKALRVEEPLLWILYQAGIIRAYNTEDENLKRKSFLNFKPKK